MTTTLVAAAEPPAELHAPWCSGGCPRWLASGYPTCLPTPCQCAATKEDAPPWRKDLGDVKCWWRKRVGGIASRCPCWGSPRDGRPGDCCSHHSANPLYLLDADGMLAEPDTVLEAAAEVPDEPEGDRPPDADAVVWDDVPWEAERPERKPVVRRWRPDELICVHTEAEMPAKGIHCQNCCLNWANEMAMGMHAASYSSPCRRPEDIRDVDTGVPLLQLNAHGAWAIDWAANRA